MRTGVLIVAGVFGSAATAAAQQYPPLNPQNVMPNVYNPQTQPLSPYLNLLRGGGNAASNYYYGVRPGTVGGGAMFGAGSQLAPGGMRGPFMPQLASNPDAIDLPDRSAGYSVPPAGHPVVFNNTLGYYPGSVGGMMGRGGQPGRTVAGAAGQGQAGRQPTSGRGGR